MAFHVACPITCRRICFCDLGFSRGLQRDNGKHEFVSQVLRIEEFVKDPWFIEADSNATVQVSVPRVELVAPPPRLDVDEAALEASAKTKRVALQKKGATASLVAEDFARRYESGRDPGQDENNTQEECSLSVAKVMCRLCFGGETEASENARKMLPCKICGKKYHRSCLKNWSQNRDLFHWSSWSCPSCRVCETCEKSGDPAKFMFCKRCDAAAHCYCLQQPHKNVFNGPYLCPKHTKCHSCASSVPGNGLSVRWFLGYTCCDACGRLFLKGNYCPVCLKVYRDSESTPMVCCDNCHRWVHCQCDGISDSKYLQFQVDGNLQYVCPTCRGDCKQIGSPEEAVQELWKKRTEADRHLIVNLRAAAGLPIEDEIFSISPFSDDEENTPAGMKNENVRSLKFSLKGSADRSPKKNKDYVKTYSSKKSSKKKGLVMSLDSGAELHQKLGRDGDAPSFGINVINNDYEQKQSGEPYSHISPRAGSLTEGKHAGKKEGVVKHKSIGDVTEAQNSRAPNTVKIKSSKIQGGVLNDGGDSGNQASMSKATRGTKLVIHLSSRTRNSTSSPMSEGSSYQKDLDVTTSNGSEDIGHPRTKESASRHENKAILGDGKDQGKSSKFRGKEGNLIKIKKSSMEVTDMPSRFGGSKLSDTFGSISALNTRSSSAKRTAEGSSTGVKINNEVSLSGRANKLSSMPSSDEISQPHITSIQKESKPLLRLKIKNPMSENQSSSAPLALALALPLKEDEKSFAKGQRSKRKRPSPSSEKVPAKIEEDASRVYEDRTMDEIMDANWILQKLGKDAIGKRVEVHQPSDNSWHRGTVIEVFEARSAVSVSLDNGKAKNLELGKQGIRFISQKQKRR